VNSLNSTSSTSDGPSRHRQLLPALTGIRFIAAFYVVVFHALPWLQQRFALPQPVRTFLGNGYLAVSLFFILSGFILAYTYEGQIAGSINRKRFWEARFARIYPVYVLSLFLSWWFERGLPVKTRLAVLAMVQAWNPRAPELTGAWNYPAWSLSVEIFFYLCFPFVLPRFARISDRALVCLIGLATLAIVFLFTPIRGLGILDRTSMVSAYIPLPVLRIPEFFLGTAIGLKLLRKERQEGIAGNALLTSLAALAAVALLALPIGRWVSLVAIPFAVLVYQLAAGGTLLAKFLSTQPMVLLGSASYAVYLLQFPARSWMRVFFQDASGRLASLGAPLTPVVLVLFSIGVFYCWEEPCRRKLRARFARSPIAPQADGLAR